jgi:hypothetical protein
MNYALDISLRLERILEDLQSPNSSNHNSYSHPAAFAQQGQIPNESRDSNIFTPPNPPFHRASMSTTYSAQTMQTEGGSIVSVPGQAPGTYGVQYIGRDGDDQGFIAPFLSTNGNNSVPGTPRPGIIGTPGTASPEPPTLAGTHIEDLEERALQLAMEEGPSHWSRARPTTLTRNSVPDVSDRTQTLGGKRSRMPDWEYHFIGGR